MKYIFFILLSIALLMPSVMRGNDADGDSVKKVRVIVLPIAFKSPETGWAFGLTSSVSFKTSNRYDTLTRTSSIQPVAFYTTNGQNVEAMNTTIYFPKERYIFFNQISHSYYPDKFWGIGPYTKDGNVEHYAYEQFYFFPRISRMIRKNFFAGLLYEYQNVYKMSFVKGGVFDTSAFYGKSNYMVSGLGASVTYDSRNISFSPTRGFLIESLVDGFHKAIGSNYNFVKWTIDIRSFFKLIGNTVLAAQFYNYSTFGKTPLRDQATLGGANNMRGIYEGRFRDNNSTSLIVEYRVPLFWKFSMCTFGDIGNVYHSREDLRSPLKYSFGEGLRIALLKKDKLNLRLDYGYYTKKNQGFYLNVGECF
ncbi:MAG: BamA/TamA family outer membrane protein [Bacteroidia bacterium]